MLIYLDDIRIPEQDIWKVVRTPDEFRHAILNSREISVISFDHDLGECETGYDLMKWMIDKHLDGAIDLTGTVAHVHSANPIGAQNIKALWSNFRKELENDTREN